MRLKRRDEGETVYQDDSRREAEIIQKHQKTQNLQLSSSENPENTY